MQNKKIWSSLLMLALGVALIIWNKAASSVVMTILAVGLMLVGAATILQQFTVKDGSKTDLAVKILLGIVYIALGIITLAKKDLVFDIVKYVVGGATILYGFKDLIPAIREKRGWLSIALPALAILLGLAVILFTDRGTPFLLAGIAFVYVGLQSLISELKAK